MEKRVYKTKIGWGLVVMFAIVLIPQVVMCFYNPVSIYQVLVLVGVLLLIASIFLKTYYTVEGVNLTIKSSFLYNNTISIKSIRKVEETRSPLSSPAASIDRLEVYYNKFDTVIISPKEKAAFVAHLQQINPEIVFIPRKKKV